jgi:thiamine-phosphate pyrophosphorylase
MNNLPDPPLLVVTDRHQARLPLADVIGAALSAGCRWVSMREKDLSDDDQIALASMLLPIARRHGARLTVHGDATLAKACGADGVHLPAGADAGEAHKILGREKLLGVSLHTVTEAEAIDPAIVDHPPHARASRRSASPATVPQSAARGLQRLPARRPSPSSRSEASMRRGRRRCWP